MKCKELKVVVVNPPTEKQKDEMLKRIENYFNGGFTNEKVKN
jgi:hypothetical protein